VVDSPLSLLLDFDVDSCCFAFVPDDRIVYTTGRGLRALRHGANVLDTRFASRCYLKRLEKYAQRGFAIGVPGYLPERVSQDLLQASYVFIDKCDLLLKLGASDAANEREVVFQSDPFTARFDKLKITARLCQHADCVGGLARLIVLDRGLARNVRMPKRWKCERHSKVFCESALHSGACAPIRKGAAGEYWVCWGVQEPAGHSTDHEEDEGYDSTPLAQVYTILEKASLQDALADPTSEEGWSRGGVMQRISESMKRDAPDGERVALEAHAARTSTGNPIQLASVLLPARRSRSNVQRIWGHCPPPQERCSSTGLYGTLSRLPPSLKH
jgi:hypothetical protein